MMERWMFDAVSAEVAYRAEQMYRSKRADNLVRGRRAAHKAEAASKTAANRKVEWTAAEPESAVSTNSREKVSVG